MITNESLAISFQTTLQKLQSNFDWIRLSKMLEFFIQSGNKLLTLKLSNFYTYHGAKSFLDIMYLYAVKNLNYIVIFPYVFL